MARPKVLIVDDQRSIRGLLKAVLEQMGAEVVDEAGDGEEAIVKYRQHQPHMVLLDINMPKMDGIDALKGIMKINPKALVIMLTSQNTMEVINDCLEAGASNYILKNNPPDALAKELKETWADYIQTQTAV